MNKTLDHSGKTILLLHSPQPMANRGHVALACDEEGVEYIIEWSNFDPEVPYDPTHSDWADYKIKKLYS